MPSVRCARPYADPDERELVERRVAELVTDADERPPRVERSGDDVEQRPAMLEQLEQSTVRAHLIRARVVEKAGRAADEHALLLRGGLPQHRPDESRNDRSTRERPESSRRLTQSPRAEPHADQLLVEVGTGPFDEARIDGVRRTGTAASSPTLPR